jgi:ABC-type hemin transport system substrate-binding protein
MAGKKNMAHRREARRVRAVELHEERSKRTEQQQLEHLDALLGVGQGAKKERERLLSRITALEEKFASKKPRKKDRVSKNRKK